MPQPAAGGLGRALGAGGLGRALRAGGPGRALGAELVRVRRSPAALLPLVGVVVCAMSGVGRLAVSGADGGWTGLLYWHTLYVTGLSAVLVALLAGLTEMRDRRARSGATGCRPARPSTVRAARLLTLAALALLLNLLVFLPYVPLGTALGLRDAPVGTLAGAAVLVWAAGLGWLTVACAIARRTGPFPVIALSLIWQAAGAVQAESDRWWAMPWTWAVRPALPLVGVHHNGVPLEPGSPVWHYPAWPAVLASLLLVAVALPAAVGGGIPDGPSSGNRFGGRRSPRRLAPPARRAGSMPTPSARAAPPKPRTASTLAPPKPRTASTLAPPKLRAASTLAPPKLRAASTLAPPKLRSVHAVVTSLRRTAIGPLTCAAAGLLTLVAVVRPTYLQGLFGFVVLPTGASVLAVLAWHAHAPAWRIVLTRSTRPHRVQWALLAVLACVVVGVCALVGGLLLLTGDAAPEGIGAVLPRCAVGVCIGWAAVALTLWLHTRFHLAVALTAAVLAGLTGVLFGGSSLAGGALWLAGPAAWFVSATGPDRAAPAVALSLLAAAAGTIGWLRASRRDSAIR